MSSIAPPADVALAADRRAVRMAAQSVLWRESSLSRLRACGKTVHSVEAGVQVRVSSGEDGARHAGFAGLQTCGSVWSCPVCSAKILAHRQGEVAQAVRTWRARDDGQVSMLTFTLKHTAADTLADVWDAVSAAHHAATSGRGWMVDQANHGLDLGDGRIIDTCDVASCGARYTCDVASCGQLDTARGRKHAASGRCRVGQLTDRAIRHAPHCMIGTPVGYSIPWLRVVEVTEGANGWHVHVHLLAFLPSTATEASLWGLYESMWARWASGAAAAGFDGSLRVNRPVFFDGDAAETLAGYVTKATYSADQRAGLELVRGDLKSARFGNRSPMELLRDLVLQPDLERVTADAGKWREWEQGSKGRRQMTWAHGARVLLGLDEIAADDQDIAATETGTAEDAVIHLDAEDWKGVRQVAGRRYALLRAAEDSLDAAVGLLDQWGVDFVGLKAYGTFVPAVALVT